MSGSVILAYLGGGDADEAVLRAALAVARRMPSHIRALHLRGDPLASIVFASSEGAPVATEIVEMAEREIGERASRARRAFETWRTAHHLPLLDAPTKHDGISASLVVETGPTNRGIALHGRLADLVVVPREDILAGDPTLALEAAIFDAGRPALLVPSHWRGELFGKAVIAWKSSAEAARAVAAALPLLAKAETVDIFAATEHDVAPATPDGLVAYLRWHGIAATAMMFPAEAPSVGEALLAAARHAAADLLVMGAYSRSRVRELVFGGVTRHVLDHAALPVLMAH
jgi:nucleotide-binding universal stress UspA family protein